MSSSRKPYVERNEIEAALALVRELMPVTPCISWPQISSLAGCEVWVKHENHTPIGAFKIRGGLAYMHKLVGTQPDVAGVISATRGNHGQSIALAAARVGVPATIVVPRGNSREKNAAMRAFGATLIEHGDDFQDALVHAGGLAEQKNLHLVPAFDRSLVIGVSTYSWELFHQQPALDRLYVPIGLGSGICGAIAARDLLGAKLSIIGVIAEDAPAYGLSFDAGRCVSAPARTRLADGVACRVPSEEAFAMIRTGVERIVRVAETEIAQAMRQYYLCTHNLAEGAGALALAAVLKDRPARHERVGVVLSGANVDWTVYRSALGD